MATPTARRRIGDNDKEFVKSLDLIDGKDVWVHSFSTTARPLTTDGERTERPFTVLEISETEDGPVQTFHTWSESVAEKLAAIPKDDLPMPGMFKKIRTGGGFEVWDVS